MGVYTKEISAIEDKILELMDQVHDLRKRRESLKFKDKNLEGKFIKRKDYGYMFVTWQTVDKLKNKDGIILQGLSFSFELNDGYRDSAWMNFDALNEWYIPNDTFYRDDEFEIITKEEFINAFKEGFTNSIKFGLDWIDKVERNYLEKDSE